MLQGQKLKTCESLQHQKPHLDVLNSFCRSPGLCEEEGWCHMNNSRRRLRKVLMICRTQKQRYEMHGMLSAAQTLSLKILVALKRGCGNLCQTTDLHLTTRNKQIL
jgi:hypothetical protein